MQLGPYVTAPEGGTGVIHDDGISVMENLPDNCIDSIFTDPPWSPDFTYLFYSMAREAKRILKPGGILMTFTGKAELDIVISHLSSHLDYHWLTIGWQPQSNLMFMPRRFMEKFRPALIYSKGKANTHPFISDARKTTRDKRFHEWGQGIEFWEYYINLLGGDVILDPFCGGGTTAVVCKRLGKKWLTAEIDEKTAVAANHRIAHTTMPLITDVDVPEQGELEYE